MHCHGGYETAMPETPDIDWMITATYYDPAAGRDYEMTLDTIAEAFGNLTPVQAVRAHAITRTPVDLGDGVGPRTEIGSIDLARMCHRYDRYMKGLAD